MFSDPHFRSCGFRCGHKPWPRIGAEGLGLVCGGRSDIVAISLCRFLCIGNAFRQGELLIMSGALKLLIRSSEWHPRSVPDGDGKTETGTRT